MLTATRGPLRSCRARWAAALLSVLTLSGCAAEVVPGSAEYAPSGSGGILVREPCPHSEFECITIGVPADHFTPGSEIWEVTFALHRARDRSEGVFVTATGGPGFSGIAEADQRLAMMSPDITDNYDVVFFDQRGIGRSEPFRCDEAFWFASEVVDTSSTTPERNSFAGATARFVDECFAEAGVDPADAELYGTRQAAEDLEAFRDWLDADQLVLYGESYGTQLQQTYAVAHPDRVQAMVLDGVVDLRTDALDFGLQQALAYNEVLAAVLSSCDAQSRCAADAPGSALAEFDRLAARLAEEPVTFDYPMPSGTTREREFTLEALRGAVTATLSEPAARMTLQQALNAAAVDDFLPLARLAEATSPEPGSGDLQPDSTFSDAAYYAVQCADYDVVPEGRSGREQLDVWLDAVAASGIDHQRLGGLAYGDLPCLFWPDGGVRPSRPDPGTDPPYPLLLLGADTDPNTPVRNAEQVLARSADAAALVLLQGGPHGTYGRGDPCVDGAVVAVVTAGRLPQTPRTTCPGEIAHPYRPLPPPSATGYVDAWETVQIVLDAVLDNPLYASWAGPEHLVLGCDDGGSARYLIDPDGTVQVWLAGCEWTDDVPVDGYVSVTDGGNGHVSATLALPFADLSVRQDGSIAGEFRGSPVD